MAELLRLAWDLRKPVLEALLSLLRAIKRGDSEEEIRWRAENLAHVAGFEAALAAARKAGRRSVQP